MGEIEYIVVINEHYVHKEQRGVGKREAITNACDRFEQHYGNLINYAVDNNLTEDQIASIENDSEILTIRIYAC
jgi:hypothetical protein